MMAGRYSAADLSGVAIGGSIWFPVFMFLLGILSSLMPTVAQFHGSNNVAPVAKYVQQSMMQALAFSPLVFILGFYMPQLLELIQVDVATQPIASGYVRAMALGLPAVLGFNVLRFFSDGLSLTRPAVVASVVALAVNIPLNYLLIFGKFGFPEMGGVGCGWASAISFWVMFLFMAAVVFAKKSYAPFHLLKNFHPPHWPTHKSLLKVGLPIGFSYFVESSMFGVIALFLASLGPTVVAAHQIALNFSALVFMVPLSLSMALTVRVGFLVGAQQTQEARFTAHLGFVFAIVYGLVSALMLFFFRSNIASLYSENPEVVAMAATLLSYAAFFQLGDVLQVTAAGVLRGYKDTRVCMLIMIFSFWCFSLPIGYTLAMTDWFGHPWHAEGFWLGLVIGLFTTGAMLVWRFNSIAKRHLASSYAT